MENLGGRKNKYLLYLSRADQILDAIRNNMCGFQTRLCASKASRAWGKEEVKMITTFPIGIDQILVPCSLNDSSRVLQAIASCSIVALLDQAREHHSATQKVRILLVAAAPEMLDIVHRQMQSAAGCRLRSGLWKAWKEKIAFANNWGSAGPAIEQWKVKVAKVHPWSLRSL